VESESKQKVKKHTRIDQKLLFAESSYFLFFSSEETP